jgi:hypothetical protein
MKENIQNQGQQKTAKNLKKVQNLKVAVATALGLTAGTGVVIAADQLLNNEDVVAEPAVEKEEVAAAALNDLNNRLKEIVSQINI